MAYLHTACLFGDSIVAQCEDEATAETNGYYSAYSWVWRAQQRLGYPLVITANYGVGGNKTADMLARIDQPISDPAQWVIMDGLVNDLFDGTGTTLATMQANLTSIFSQLVAAGKQVAYMLPTGSGYGTPTTLTNLYTMIRWVKKYARENQGIVLFDGHGYYSDPVDGMPVAGYVRPGDASPANSNRGVHPGFIGCVEIGRALAEAVGPFLAGVDGRLAATNADTLNVLDNGRFSGNAGSGLAPSWSVMDGGGLSIASHVTATKQARSDGRPGEVQQVVYDGKASDGRLFQQQTDTTRFTAGDRVVFEVEFETDPDTAGDYTFSIQCDAWNGGSTASVSSVSPASTQDLTDPVQPAARGVDVHPRRGVLRTVPLTLPAGTSRVQCSIWLPPGTTRFLAATVRKVDF